MTRVTSNVIVVFCSYVIVVLIGFWIGSYVNGERRLEDVQHARRADCRDAFLSNLVTYHDAQRDQRDGRDDTINLAAARGGLQTTLHLCFPGAEDHRPHPANLLVDLDSTTSTARLAEVDRLLEVGWEQSTVGEPWRGEVP